MSHYLGMLLSIRKLLVSNIIETKKTSEEGNFALK
jgi:hypothetical protein